MAEIFVSYSRQDAAEPTQRLVRALRTAFPARDPQNPNAHVFLCDSIPLGVEWESQLKRETKNCHVGIVVIGPGWQSQLRSSEHRWVAKEVEMMLRFAPRVISIVLPGARMPQRDELPQQIQDLPGRQGIAIRDVEALDQEISQLVDEIRQGDEIELDRGDGSQPIFVRRLPPMQLVSPRPAEMPCATFGRGVEILRRQVEEAVPSWSPDMVVGLNATGTALAVFLDLNSTIRETWEFLPNIITSQGVIRGPEHLNVNLPSAADVQQRRSKRAPVKVLLVDGQMKSGNSAMLAIAALESAYKGLNLDLRLAVLVACGVRLEPRAGNSYSMNELFTSGRNLHFEKNPTATIAKLPHYLAFITHQPGLRGPFGTP